MLVKVKDLQCRTAEASLSFPLFSVILKTNECLTYKYTTSTWYSVCSTCQKTCYHYFTSFFPSWCLVENCTVDLLFVPSFLPTSRPFWWVLYLKLLWIELNALCHDFRIQERYWGAALMMVACQVIWNCQKLKDRATEVVSHPSSEEKENSWVVAL